MKTEDIVNTYIFMEQLVKSPLILVIALISIIIIGSFIQWVSVELSLRKYNRYADKELES